MSQVLIIAYDLFEPGKNFEPLLRKIKGYASWARLGGSAYLVCTEENPIAVRDDLRQVLHVSDKLYVGVVRAPAGWVGMSEEVSKWIQANQK